jgi:hypothetical protein
MVGLILLGIVLTRVLGRTNPHVSDDRAVAIGRRHVDFTPDGDTVRLVRRGIPPKPFWLVSYWQRAAGGGYKRITLVLVDANTGNIAEIRRTR